MQPPEVSVRHTSLSLICASRGGGAGRGHGHTGIQLWELPASSAGWCRQAVLLRLVSMRPVPSACCRRLAPPRPSPPAGEARLPPGPPSSGCRGRRGGRRREPPPAWQWHLLDVIQPCIAPACDLMLHTHTTTVAAPPHRRPHLVLHQQCIQLGDAPHPAVPGGAQVGHIGDGALVVVLPHAAAGRVVEEGAGQAGTSFFPGQVSTPPAQLLPTRSLFPLVQRHPPHTEPFCPRWPASQPPPQLVVQVLAPLGADVDVVGVEDGAPEEAAQPVHLAQRQVVPAAPHGGSVRRPASWLLARAEVHPCCCSERQVQAPLPPHACSGTPRAPSLTWRT